MQKLKSILILLAVLGLSVSINAQMIIVQKADGTNPRLFTNLDSAVIQANPNDYIYIGGGEYNIQSEWLGYDGVSTPKSNWLVVEKPLHFVGGGYMPGSDIPTAIKGSLVLRQAASGSTITGILFKDVVYLDSISNTTISRCRFENMLYLYGTGSNDVITECWFQYVSTSGFSGIAGGHPNLTSNFVDISSYTCIISKSIFHPAIASVLSHLRYATITNNIIFAGYSISDCEYLIVENNIFDYPGNISVTNSTFRNNIIANNVIPQGTTNTVQGTIVEPQLDVFVNISSLPYDYHLKSTSLGKNAGTDGTDIGIYGTSNPFKDGGTTAYPQILRSAIGSETNAAGKLKVDIEAEAQSR